MGAVSAGLIAGTGLKLMRALRANAMGKSVCALLAVLTFMAIGLLRLPLIWVLLGLGLPAMGWAYFRLLAQYTNTRA
jgi:chromate transporter